MNRGIDGIVRGFRLRFSVMLGENSFTQDSRDGKAVVFAFDHGVEHGPADFPPEHIDPRVILRKVVEANVDVVMLLLCMTL